MPALPQRDGVAQKAVKKATTTVQQQKSNAVGERGISVKETLLDSSSGIADTASPTAQTTGLPAESTPYVPYNPSPAADAWREYGVPVLVIINVLYLLRIIWRFVWPGNYRYDGDNPVARDQLADKIQRLEQRLETRLESRPPLFATSASSKPVVAVQRPEFDDVRAEVVSLRAEVEAIKRAQIAQRTPPLAPQSNGYRPQHQATPTTEPPRAPALSVEVDEQGNLRLSHALTAMAMAETSVASGTVAVKLNPERFFENAEISMWTQFFDFPNDKATAAMYRTAEPALVSYANGEFGRIVRKGRVERTA